MSLGVQGNRVDAERLDQAAGPNERFSDGGVTGLGPQGGEHG